VLETLSLSPKYCSQLTDAFIVATLDFSGRLKTLGYTNRLCNSDEIFDRSLINRVHPEKDHYEEGLSVY